MNNFKKLLDGSINEGKKITSRSGDVIEITGLTPVDSKGYISVGYKINGKGYWPVSISNKLPKDVIKKIAALVDAAAVDFKDN